MEDGDPSGRRPSRRISIQSAKGLVGAAYGAVLKIAEPKREIDPEEEPDFAERNPLWEDDLPPIHPQNSEALALEEDTAKKKIPTVVPTSNYHPKSLSVAQKRWQTAYHAVKKNLALLNQSLRSSVGTGAEVHGRSFGRWDKYDPNRIFLFQLLYNMTTEYIIFVLINLHVVIIILKASKRGSLKDSRITMQQLNNIDIVLTLIFSIECVLRIACLGLYKGPKAFLRNSFNKIDLLSVLDSWAHIISLSHFNESNSFRFLTLRMFRALLTLRDIEFFTQVLAIFEAIHRSLEPLEDVLLLSVVLLFFYGLVGLQFFGSDLAYRCKRKSDLQMSYPVTYCSHFSDRGFRCPSNQVCKKGANPSYGALAFDLFPLSVLTLFQVVSLESWSFVMYVMGDVEFPISVLT